MASLSKQTAEHVEIYKQRYETFRHLDKLRWQMLQIAIATGAAVLAFGGGTSTKPEWWTWASVGIIFLILGFSKMRIGSGLRRNGEVLRTAGNAIGDVNVPKQSSSCGSVSFWIAITMMVVGSVCLALAYYYLAYTT